MNTIYTVGYTGLQPAVLLEATLQLDLVVVDTRFSQRSRNPVWDSKWLMGMLLHESYISVPQFGNRNYNSPGDILIDDMAWGIKRVKPILERHSVVLLCACVDVNTCHRKIVAEALAVATGCQVEHWTAVGMHQRFGAQPETKPTGQLPLF